MRASNIFLLYRNEFRASRIVVVSRCQKQVYKEKLEQFLRTLKLLLSLSTPAAVGDAQGVCDLEL